MAKHAQGRAIDIPGKGKRYEWILLSFNWNRTEADLEYQIDGGPRIRMTKEQAQQIARELLDEDNWT